MVNSNTTYNSENIRNQLGDFSNIKHPGKYLARVGLALSASKYIMTLNEDQIEVIPEIEHSEFIFSDGVGKVSQSIVDQINSIGRFNSCAFQIRLGGIKGVLALDDRLEGSIIQVRPSQIKFECHFTDIELVNPSEFRYGYLNRQLIMLLSSLGVPNHIFNSLQNEMLDLLKNDFKKYIKYIKEISKGSIAVQIFERLLDYPKEPAFYQLKKLLTTRALAELRTKHRIWVRKSGCLMGVLDEKAELEYGEVFLQIQDIGIIEGPVVVAKNPCLHPGDVRRLMARNIPALHHLFNVLVFPQKGCRPHTNECSGSDLDGDLYFITWDIRLIPSLVAEPMKYDVETPLVVRGPYKISHVVDFFNYFISNDKLGQIDNLHLAIADSSPLYAFDERCLELCKLHASSVDFAKNGKIIKIPKELQTDSRPDFMKAKKSLVKSQNGNFYKSDKILGILYRNIEDLPEENCPCFQVNNLCEGYEESLNEAQEIYKNYQDELKIYLNQYGIDTELEFLIGQPIKMSKFYKKRKRQDEMIEILTYVSNRLIEKFRNIFYQTPSYKLANAIYFVVHTSETPYTMFPWVICGDYIFNKT